MKIYQIDAFTDQVFGGNPAAVLPLEQWISSELMQKIAGENNLSETVFFVKNTNAYEIRWFTPVAEVDLCGHATIAAAWVIRHELGDRSATLLLKSNSGQLGASFSKDLIQLNFPTIVAKPVSVPEALIEGLGVMPLEVKAVKNNDFLVVLPNADLVADVQPEFPLLAKLPGRGVIITAESDLPDVDFVSRAFYPKLGINEDPVTGSSYTLLIPYWAKRFKKSSLSAKQISKRSGEVWCELKGDRVIISGKAVKYLEGKIECKA